VKTEAIHSCNKCGLCLLTCPVYQETKEETHSPRAKVQLIKHYVQNDLPASYSLQNIVSKCLMCGSCTASCPSGVEHDLLFMQMRSEMIRDVGQEWMLKVLFHFLFHEQQLRFAARAARLGRSLASERLLKKYSLGGISLEKTPVFNRIPFRKQLSAVNEPNGPVRGTVIYFTGCATQYIDGKVGLAVVQVLKAMGFRVLIPKEQGCCGVPIFLNGRPDQAADLIHKNVACLNQEEVEAVVVDCATCGSALRREYPKLLREFGRPASDAERLAAQVEDISEFIFNRFEYLEPGLIPEAKGPGVTYHAPCHLRNAQGVGRQVESLLQALPGVRFRAVADQNACCGGGGSFFFKYPDSAKKIVSSKIDSIVRSKASVLATGCPSCRINFAGNLPEPISVLHPVQLVADCLQGGDG
jgi:glycolate oxidase iron-sulfur subunit